MKSVVMVQQRLVYFAFSLQEGCFFFSSYRHFFEKFCSISVPKANGEKPERNWFQHDVTKKKRI